MQRQAAEEIGQTERHVRRLLKQLKAKGDKAIVHAPRGRRFAASDDTHTWIHGYDVTDFTDTIFLLHRGRLPNYGERRIRNAILIAVADHGAGAPSRAAARMAASGNRQSPSAAVATGVLAIGDEHGGAGSACMEMIAAGVEIARRDSISIKAAARQVTADARAKKMRLPGLGRRVHSVDPRQAILFKMARDAGVAGKGVAFMEALEQAAREKIKPLPVNVDGALAALLYDLGFSPLFGKLVLIIGRVAGLTAEVTEEYSSEKPMRIHIPVTYNGVPPRELG